MLDWIVREDEKMGDFPNMSRIDTWLDMCAVNKAMVPDNGAMFCQVAKTKEPENLPVAKSATEAVESA